MSKNRKHLTELEFTKLIDFVKNHSDEQPAQVLGLMISSGMRAQEIAHVCIDDINTHESWFMVRALKNSKDRKIFMSSDWQKKLLVTIEKQMRDHGAKYFSYLFCKSNKPLSVSRSVLRMLKAVFTKVLCDDSFGSHCIRHTVTMTLYQSSKDIVMTAAAMGHRSINSTMRYLDYINEQRAGQELSSVIASIGEKKEKVA